MKKCFRCEQMKSSGAYEVVKKSADAKGFIMESKIQWKGFMGGKVVYYCNIHKPPGATPL